MVKRSFILAISSWIAAILALLLLGASFWWQAQVKLYQHQSKRNIEYLAAKNMISDYIQELESVEDKFSYIHSSILRGKEGVSQEGSKLKLAVLPVTQLFNINTISYEMLVSLLDEIEIGSTKTLAANILAWRGEKESKNIPKDSFNYFAKGYDCKRSAFEAIEELELVKGIDKLDSLKYGKLKQLLTIYGNGKININYADQLSLTVFFEQLRKKTNSNFDSSKIAETFLFAQEEKGIVFTDYKSLENFIGNLMSRFWNSKVQTEYRLHSNILEFKSSDLFLKVERQTKDNQRVVLDTLYNHESKKIIYLGSIL